MLDCSCIRARLLVGLEEEPQVPLAVPRNLGNYEVLEPIARGGMGVVYKARDTKLGRLVALKMLIGGEWAGESARLSFWREAELAAYVERPHIVPIYDVGECDGQPYYVMPLMPASLAERASDFKDVTKVAELVVPIARAIDFGHKRSVVHLDLKPGNILLDEGDQPFVADFGVSRRLGGERMTTAQGFRATPGYMAPEQADSEGDLTHAVDVWGLGAVLYDLVCGRTPFEPKLDLESLRKLRDENPPSPRSLVSGFDADFEAIILKCLEKVPQHRYETAAALADDLERWLAGKPVLARPLGAWGRIGRWCRRHPPRAAAIASAVCFAGVFCGKYVHEVGALEQALEDEVLRTNTWVARAQAGVVESRLHTLSKLVAEAAANDAVVKRLDPIQPPPPSSRAAEWRPPMFERFDSFMLLDVKGTLRARVPASPKHVGADLSHRSYFSCALAPPHDVAARTCVSGAYRSDIDGAFRFAVSAPVRSGNGSPLGVAVGTLKADSVLVSLVIPENVGPGTVERGTESRRRRIVALAARRDRKPAETESLPGEWLLLQHQALEPGSSVAVRSPALATLTPAQASQTDNRYRDPALGGRWLAAFARVAGTSWAVIVQTPEDVVGEPHRRLIDWLLRAAGLAAVAGLGVGLASYLVARGRARSR